MVSECKNSNKAHAKRTFEAKLSGGEGIEMGVLPDGNESEWKRSRGQRWIGSGVRAPLASHDDVYRVSIIVSLCGAVLDL
jgi:hypothetical protein